MSHENNEQGTLLELAKYRLQVAKEDLETALDNEKAGKMIKKGVELGRPYSLKFTKKFAIRRKRLGMADFFHGRKLWQGQWRLDCRILEI